MDVEINFQTHIPIYNQVMDQIKHKIAAKELVPGDQLPTVRQLAAELSVNFNTIARAYRLLDETGIISTQHGRGTYILDQPNAEAAEKLRHQTLAKLAEYFLTQAKILGHSPDQIRAALEEKIVDDQIERANILAKRKLKPSRKNQ